MTAAGPEILNTHTHRGWERSCMSLRGLEDTRNTGEGWVACYLTNWNSSAEMIMEAALK